ncbi:hypothetical protein ACFWY5_29880 [Nonomuraea sp. NPDC059007]|uniref:hypothetical protein n=1 Tax=Nonomuraea sp. NPDC059007 TaxID=3346692 RepID=UPI00367BB1FD
MVADIAKGPYVTVELEGLERRVERRQDSAHMVFNILANNRVDALGYALYVREIILEKFPQTSHMINAKPDNIAFVLDVTENIGLSDLTEMETNYIRFMFSAHIYITQN